MEKREPSYKIGNVNWWKCKLVVGGNVNWRKHYVKQYRSSFKKKLKLELPYGLAIPLLGVYPENTKTLI